MTHRTTRVSELIRRDLADAKAQRDARRTHAMPTAMLLDVFIVEEDEPRQIEAVDAPPIQESEVLIPLGNETPEDGITAKCLEQEDLDDV